MCRMAENQHVSRLPNHETGVSFQILVALQSRHLSFHIPSTARIFPLPTSIQDMYSVSYKQDILRSHAPKARRALRNGTPPYRLPSGENGTRTAAVPPAASHRIVFVVNRSHRFCSIVSLAPRTVRGENGPVPVRIDDEEPSRESNRAVFVQRNRSSV